MQDATRPNQLKHLPWKENVKWKVMAKPSQDIKIWSIPLRTTEVWLQLEQEKLETQPRLLQSGKILDSRPQKQHAT